MGECRRFLVQRVRDVLDPEFFRYMTEGILYFDNKHARYFCPCGCEAYCVLPLGKPDEISPERATDDPRWSLMVLEGRPTLYPAVKSISCGRRYSMKSGEIEYLKD